MSDDVDVAVVFLGGVAYRLLPRFRAGEDLHRFIAPVFVHLLDPPVTCVDPVLKDLCTEIRGSWAGGSVLGLALHGSVCSWRLVLAHNDQSVSRQNPLLST